VRVSVVIRPCRSIHSGWSTTPTTSPLAAAVNYFCVILPVPYRSVPSCIFFLQPEHPFSLCHGGETLLRTQLTARHGLVEGPRCATSGLRPPQTLPRRSLFAVSSARWFSALLYCARDMARFRVVWRVGWSVRIGTRGESPSRAWGVLTCVCLVGTGDHPSVYLEFGPGLELLRQRSLVVGSGLVSGFDGLSRLLSI
jgi:hypothetical protein